MDLVCDKYHEDNCGDIQQYFRYIVAVSFIGGGNLGTRRNPPTCCKPMTNFIK
jgi:hypothetical protein